MSRRTADLALARRLSPSARRSSWAYLRYVWYAGAHARLDARRRAPTSCSLRGCSGSPCSRRTSSGCSAVAWPICRWRSASLSVAAPRSAFVALLALGLSRLARTRDDAEGLHGLPRRRVRLACPTRPRATRAAEVQKALDARPKDSHRAPRHVRRAVRASSARRRREGAASRRHSSATRTPGPRPASAPGPTSRARSSSRTALSGGLPAARGDALRRRADRRRPPRRGEPRHELRREGSSPCRTTARCRARSRCAICACPSGCRSARRSSSTRRSSRAAPQKVKREP